MNAKDRRAARERAERWAIENVLGPDAAPAKVPLTWGGNFDADGALGDAIACVSTAWSARTGPMNKLHKDASMMMHVRCAGRRILILAYREPYDALMRQRELGRFWPHSEIEIVRVQLPADLKREVDDANQVSRNEQGYRP